MILVHLFVYICIFNNIVESKFEASNNELRKTQNRTSKFLFDAIFRIGSGISNVFGDNVDEDTDYDDTNIKTCDCGKFVLIEI